MRANAKACIHVGCVCVRCTCLCPVRSSWDFQHYMFSVKSPSISDQITLAFEFHIVLYFEFKHGYHNSTFLYFSVMSYCCAKDQHLMMICSVYWPSMKQLLQELLFKQRSQSLNLLEHLLTLVVLQLIPIPMGGNWVFLNQSTFTALFRIMW